MRKTSLFAGFLAACLVGTGGALAIEINVLSAGAVQEAEKAIAEDFRHATGNKVGTRAMVAPPRPRRAGESF